MMLCVNDIDVFYGEIHAVKGVSFHVDEGEIVTLIGANGAGKSTILRAISGLHRPKSGSIAFLGEEITKVDTRLLISRGLSHVPEGRRVFPGLTVEENLMAGAYTRPRGEARDSLADVYRRFPRLLERRRQTAGTLSGGEQQMLAIGRALMARPKLIMLDEPSMGLAPMLVEQIFSIIGELDRSGVTVLLVEQNARMALSVAHRGYVLETGRVALSGSGEELLKNDRVKQSYLGG